MKIVVLDAVTLGEEIDLYELKKFGELSVFDNTKSDQVSERAKEAQIIITNKVKIHANHLEELTDLKLICVAATGVDIIDHSACELKNVVIKNVKGYSTQSVTQHVFSMLFSLLSNSSFYDKYCKSEDWEKSQIFTNLSRPFWEISNKRWGIVGLGAIGKSVASIASSFGCEVVYHSVSGVKQNVPYDCLDLESLLKTSDIISLHCPLNDKTNGLLNFSNMSLIQDHAVLINVARGAVINSNDLVKIKETKPFKVALDVFDQEPFSKTHVLKTLCDHENVLMSPHIAWASVEARHTLFKGVVKNIEDFIENCHS